MMMRLGNLINLYMVNPKAPCFIKDDEGKCQIILVKW